MSDVRCQISDIRCQISDIKAKIGLIILITVLEKQELKTFLVTKSK
jgi:hypothetical protein